MEFMHRCGALFASFAIFWCVAALGNQHDYDVSQSNRYDLRRLMHPSAAELASEENGSIHIYDSLEINEVNAALNKNFERIQNMMFIRIQHLPPTAAGPTEIEDDGCD